MKHHLLAYRQRRGVVIDPESEQCHVTGKRKKALYIIWIPHRPQRHG
jgi:hypothetical protein